MQTTADTLTLNCNKPEDAELADQFAAMAPGDQFKFTGTATLTDFQNKTLVAAIDDLEVTPTEADPAADASDTPAAGADAGADAEAGTPAAVALFKNGK